MAGAVWKAPAVDWVDVEGDPSQLKVTTLHWIASLTDGDLSSSSYGTTPDDGSRVYAKKALENVPESVVIGWIQQALGAEEVANIEQRLADDILYQKTPTSGTVVPGEG